MFPFLDVHYFIRLVIFLKGAIVIDKRRLKFNPLFRHFRNNVFDFCEPKTHDANSEKELVGILSMERKVRALCVTGK